MKEARTELVLHRRGRGLDCRAGGAEQGMDRSQAIGTRRRKGHKEIGCAIPSISLGAAMGF